MTKERRKLPSKGSTHETRIGTFEWQGPHLKWCCEESTLEDGLKLMIDDYEVTELTIRKLERICRFSHFLRPIALLRARKCLKENEANPSDMKSTGIGLSFDPFSEVSLDFSYLDAIWLGGELSVSFLFGLPISVEQGG